MPLDAKALAGWIGRTRSGAAGGAPPPAGPDAKPSSAGVDFAELSRRMYEEATPEQRARLDVHREERARIAETASEIPATFERLGVRLGQRGERHVERTWERNVGVQIEGEPGAEVIRFTGAVTGHEAYRIDEDFCRLLEDPEENAKRPRF